MTEDAEVTLRRALPGLGIEVASCTGLSRFGHPPRRRGAFRLETSAGRTLKARVFLTDDDAARVGRHLDTLRDLPLPRRLAAVGRVAVETWIAGAPCAPDDREPALVEAAARLLADLHARGARPTTAHGEALAALRRTAEERLAAMTLDRVLAPAEARVLARALDEAPARVGPTGIVHGDFCAANLVRGDDGRLHAVDNEELSIGLLDYDLGMTWYRWALEPRDAARFEDAYAAASGRVPSAPACYRAAALVKGLWVRWRHDPASMEVARRRIAALAAIEAE